MNIYELPKEIEQIMAEYDQCFDQDTGEMLSTDEEYNIILNKLIEKQNKKDEMIEWMLKKRANANANIEAIGIETKRLQARAGREARTIEQMEKMIKYFIPTAEKPVIISNWTVSYRSSKATIFDDEALIPWIYKEEVTSIKIDKAAIKKAIEAGEEVTGAHIQVNNNLQIK